MTGRFHAICLLLFACWLAACSETPVSQPLRSLEASGEVSFLCAGLADGRLRGRVGEACTPLDGPDHLYALVTQTTRGEVAVIDLSADDEASVVDVNPSTPGNGFLPVGADPVDIVSTPGGEASFVAVGSVNREGIFALPTSCINAPAPNEHARDLTSWPACSLPTAPGSLAILIEPPVGGTVLDGCTAGQPESKEPEGSKTECPANLTTELGPEGRRKLAVTLPKYGEIAVIDAQWLLDQPPGSFNPCKIEISHQLEVRLPSVPITQRVPVELQEPGCVPATLNYGPRGQARVPLPAEMAVADGSMYVADRNNPVIHKLDVSRPCSIAEREPLLPLSFEAPEREVTTTHVAVSPTTSKNQQFVYAIDDQGRVMGFDVTPGSGDRTPIVRPGTLRNPFEAADRISFAAPARAVAFAQRDQPEADPTTRVALFAEHCNPDPAIDPDSTAAGYRPSPDFTSGASPRPLRGVFGFVALTNGHVAVIDVDDFDAECRRPKQTNPSAIEDFRGCANDPANVPACTKAGKSGDDEPGSGGGCFELTGGAATVSDEASCRVIQPHRARSANFVITSDENSIKAPALRGLPQLSAVDGGRTNDNSEEGRKNPKLLAVDFQGPTGKRTARVFVGTTLFTAREDEDAERKLELSPEHAVRNSLVLPLNEPRSYAAEDEFSVSYEGLIGAGRAVGISPHPDPRRKDALILTHDTRFCDRMGVQDQDFARDEAVRLAVREADLDAFARQHADVLQIVTTLPDSEQPYWQAGVGQSCGADQNGENGGFDACDDYFLDSDSETRDLRILQAYQNQLVVEPRGTETGAERARVLSMFDCCFPVPIDYNVRVGAQWLVRGAAAGLRHDVTSIVEPGPAGTPQARCRRDCRPRVKYQHNRAFEISSTNANECPEVLPEQSDPTGCIGSATASDYACKVESNTLGVPFDHPCVFENLTSRFAIYRAAVKDERGVSPTKRDMTFSWQTVGGFVPLTASIVEQTTQTYPESMAFVPELGQLVVVDPKSAGLTLISLNSVRVSRLIF